MANCPQCGDEFESDGPAGLCPQCLIQGAFDTSLGDAEFATQTLDTAAATAVDDDFGRYRIVRSIGEGGMGTVYLAEQYEPIRRVVALKVVKLGMDTGQVLARFAIERQALALMDHPNIARILDAGATPKGRPFFVMEYIDGVPITQYCDGKRMTIGQRLDLFVAVCRALEHAHQKGVVHRDLKPSNILVAEQDGKPLPKVIDFGIAKATDQWAVETTQLTQFGQMVGTPEYASPEQANVTTGDVDESTDVYSLGILLYELLIGTVPFDSARMRRAGLVEMLRIIREDEAPRLSQKLSTMPAASDVAARRQTDASSLRRLVDGDLNSIALKALEKTRERRYASVSDLAADIQRYLEHRPVAASRPSHLYRASKFLRRRRTAVLGATVGIAFIVLSAVTAWSLLRHDSPQPPKVTGKYTIVLADFAHASGDPAFNSTLRQILATQLGSSPELTLLPDARITQTLRLMVRPPDAKLTPDVAAEVCERTASAAVVDASITSLGGEYLLNLRARNCRTGAIFDDLQAPPTKNQDVVKAITELANQFRTRAGGWLPRVPNEPTLPADVTTPSLEAWRAYSAAMKGQQRHAQASETLQLFKRAIEIDPQFAMGYSLLGRLYASLGESETGEQNIAKAYALRDRVSDEEKDLITFNYHRQVTRNLELARQTLESWLEKVPGDLMAHGFLAAFTSQGSGHYDKAAEEGEKAIAIDPNYAIGYENTVFAYIYQNRLTSAEALLRQAAEHKIELTDFSICRYFISFLKGDQAAMERELAQRRTKSETQGWLEYQDALTAAYRGRLNDAARMSESAIVLSRQAGFSERAALFEGARAVWSALFGLRAEGQTSASEALSLHRSRDADYGPAFALALLGMSAPAHEIEMSLAKRYPDDTSVQFSYLPALRAIEALNQGDPAKALKMTQVAAPYDLAVPGTAFYSGAFFGALYPMYVRGLAYSRMGQHREAAAQFENIVDHPYITLNDPIGPMARLQLARELNSAGDHAKSAAVYKDLLAIWKDADHDNPVVQAARAESTK